jgi:hypothetical protein
MTNSPSENELESQSLIREVPEVWPYRPVSRTRDRNAAAKTLIEVGWTFDEVVAVLKMEGDRP